MVVTGPARHRSEMRRHERKPLHYAAWIALGPDRPPLKCMLSDVSKSGAKITVTTDEELPGEFVLLLSADGRTHRTCHVVWRNGNRMGVEFVQRPAKLNR